MTGVEPGIDDWYLNREGRWESGNSDDEPADRGPDTWLDRLTGPAAKQGRKQVFMAASRRPAKTRNKAPERMARTKATGADRRLARDAVEMNSRSGYTLSFAQVVQRMRAGGRKVTKADLKRAIRVTNTIWGAPPKKPSLPLPRRRAVTAMRMESGLAPPPRRKRRLSPTQAVQIVLDAFPALTDAQVVQHLIAKGYRVRETEVVAGRQELKKRRRAAHPTSGQDSTGPASVSGSGPATSGDEALAREAIRINRTAIQTLSYGEVTRQMRESGWEITTADLRRAIRVTKSQWGNPSRSRKARSVPPLLPAARVSSVANCDSCGLPCRDGHCGCS